VRDAKALRGRSGFGDPAVFGELGGDALVELVGALEQVGAEVGQAFAEVAEAVGAGCVGEVVLEEPVEVFVQRLAEVPDAVEQPRVLFHHDVNCGMFSRLRQTASQSQHVPASH
jgi:hypothetical protein